jgi:hypothetical protein
LTGGGFPDLAGVSWKVTAHIVMPTGTSDGALVENGNHFGGWGLYIKDGRPLFVYKSSDPKHLTTVQSPSPLLPGSHKISVVLTDNGQDSPGKAELSIDDGVQISAEVTRPIPVLITNDAEIGWSFDPINGAFAAPFRFPGTSTIERVDVELLGKRR